MEILVLAPYEANLLKAICAAKRINLGTFTLIGNKKIIFETCFREKINFQDLEIIDCLEEKDIIFVDANYENNDEAMNAVDEIAEKSSSSQNLNSSSK